MKIRMVVYFDIPEEELPPEYENGDINYWGIYDFLDLSQYLGIADVSYVSDDCDVEKCQEYEENLI